MTQEQIAIVTDSTADLPKEYIDKYGIYVLPLKVIYPHEEFNDGVDIQPEEVYRRFPDEIPSTSMPAVGNVKALFEKIRAKGIKKVVAIHISEGLSGTYGMVQMVAVDYPDMEIALIDSKALSYGLGFLVLMAADLRAQGVTFSDIVQRVRDSQKKIKIFFVLKTLEYLKKGGRIGLVAGTLGEFLDLKPVVSINEEGKYYTVTKVRGRKKSLDQVKELVVDLAKGKKVNVAVVHGDAENEAAILKAKILEELNLNSSAGFWGQIGPVLVTHTGPGLVGVAVQVLED